MAFPTNVLGILIALISGFALVHSADSIPRLLKYEEKAKKAAEWSRTAEKQLWEIRYTVGTGFVGCLLSGLSGLAFSLAVPRGVGVFTVGWPIMLAAGLTYGHQYMRNFWISKPKVPMMTDFNEAISDSMMVQDLLNPLAGAWGLVAFCKLVGL
ncbi:hypothetical protein CGCF415_v014880 [Colletotrichum fructicola]|uniref:Integral membrane protein n=1 Tax=Colletotrichum fructicola (strain Nara gc5) TaxID=1213859 RepID=L2G658_COLFN|nr:uncharacterized protein CGMCC3_g16088 [Colletotrichum fructicola]KAF4477879.1 hypothetical protein CGGC5_v013963 [Colletotrichum fructicola Nara gc5]KAI8278678.1 hypothetical protein K4K60_006143 [Colletotrichum sp. SAR11_57]KAE9567807.1 hypothetical protein CGMCC3_g16088 [Colletotrichum fructicola]KAF4411843.1 hypothetical protein CFRS1_v001574 [Colletotrichum fructicola]KAF4882396.1 hypothetical protein CGCFRS4_v014610 [Colletotrichum fructicola]